MATPRVRPCRRPYLLLYWVLALALSAHTDGVHAQPSYISSAARSNGTPAQNPYLREDFEGDDGGYPAGWTVSKAIPDRDLGRFARAPSPFIASDHGLRTQDPLRFYAVSRPLSRPLHNLGRTLIVQFSVRFEQEDIMCAGGYVKLLTGPSSSNQSGGSSASPTEAFNGEAFDSRSEYALMFGPDVCGSSRIHFILQAEQHASMAAKSDAGNAAHGDSNDNVGNSNNNAFFPAARPMLRAIDLDTETEHRSHMYTLAMYGADSTWEILVDDIVRDRGNLTDSFDFVPPLYVLDQSARKPLDWVDDEFVPAPGSAGKPAGYDDVPREIPDAEAEQPDLWSVEDDGEWIPPLVPNPDWFGEWEQELVRNPEFRGEWKTPWIPNPDFRGPNAEMRVRELHGVCDPCTHFGIDVWQVNAGTVFDDILITDSVTEAEQARAAFATKITSEILHQGNKARERKGRADL